jgi:hypothetical protein
MRAQCWDLLDIEEVVEELDSLAREIKYQVWSHLYQLLQFMLRLQYAGHRRRYCRTRITHARHEIEMYLKDSPSLALI